MNNQQQLEKWLKNNRERGQVVFFAGIAEGQPGVLHLRLQNEQGDGLDFIVRPNNGLAVDPKQTVVMEVAPGRTDELRRGNAGGSDSSDSQGIGAGAGQPPTQPGAGPNHPSGLNGALPAKVPGAPKTNSRRKPKADKIQGPANNPQS
jgi:hypothetical protein